MLKQRQEIQTQKIHEMLSEKQVSLSFDRGT